MVLAYHSFEIAERVRETFIPIEMVLPQTRLPEASYYKRLLSVETS